MPALLNDIRGRLRVDLDDVDPADRIWSDAELDRHIAEALRRLSRAQPRELKTTLATTNGSRDIDVSTIAGRVKIVAVEYKTEQFPPHYVSFSTWQNTLKVIEDPVPDGSNAAIYSHVMHQLDDATSTLEASQEDVLLLGAAALACRQQATRTTNRINTGGPNVGKDYLALAKSLEADFTAALRTSQRVHVGRLYPPDEPKPTKDTDPGP